MKEKGNFTLNNAQNDNESQWVCINHPDLLHPVKLRKGTTDVEVFKEIFLHQEYYFDIDISPRFIIDCGANIGLASIYFNWNFPDAQIVAIEPEESNFQMLVENLSFYYPSIEWLNAAIWNEGVNLRITNPQAGKWAFTYHEIFESEIDSKCIKAITVSDIMAMFQQNRIDILKIDIEGAEKELFDRGYESWLPKTKLILIETHDRFKEGCSRSLFNAISNYNFSVVQNTHIFSCINNDLWQE